MSRWCRACRSIPDDPAYYIRPTEYIYTGAPYYITGYGHNQLWGGGAGTGRAGDGGEVIEWNGYEYFFSTVTPGAGHPCSGDSGSSASKYWGWPAYGDLSLGIESNSDKPDWEDGQVCAYSGDRFRYVTFWSKMDWINSALVGVSQAPCVKRDLIPNGTCNPPFACSDYYWECW